MPIPPPCPTSCASDPPGRFIIGTTSPPSEAFRAAAGDLMITRVGHGGRRGRFGRPSIARRSARRRAAGPPRPSCAAARDRRRARRWRLRAPRCPRRHQQSGLTPDHDVAVPGHVGGDDRQARRHGFEGRQRQPFLERRRHVEVEEAVDANRVAEESREDDAVLEARLGDQAPDPGLLAAAAHQEQRQPGQTTSPAAHGLQQDLEALDGIPAAHAAEDEVVGLEPQRLAADAALSDRRSISSMSIPLTTTTLCSGLNRPERQPFRLLGARHVDDGWLNRDSRRSRPR